MAGAVGTLVLIVASTRLASVAPLLLPECCAPSRGLLPCERVTQCEGCYDFVKRAVCVFVVLLWIMFDEDKLIFLVINYKSLYDKSDRFYDDNTPNR
jgi:hypothetical protein